MTRSPRDNSNLKRVFSYISPFKKEIFLIGLTLLVSLAIGFFQPLLIQNITDNGMLQKDMAVISRSVLMLAGLVLVNQAIELWQTRIFADVHNRSYYIIFHQVFEKLLHLKKSYFLPKYLCNQKEFSGCDLSNNLIKLLEYENVKEEQFPESRLYKIPVPTIAVAGAGRFCGKFSVQLALRQMFVKSEYKLTQVGSQNYSRLFGFHCWPEFLFLNIPMAEKIIRLNHYIYDIVMKEKPEVLIFGIPGGIMPLNPFFFEEFGELAFVICNAVQIDLGIISLYAEEYTDAFLDEITKICKYKLNMPVGPIHVSSTCMHISQEQKKAEFFVSDYEYVMRILRMSVAKKYQLFSIFDRPSLEAAFEKVINSFSIG